MYGREINDAYSGTSINVGGGVFVESKSMYNRTLKKQHTPMLKLHFISNNVLLYCDTSERQYVTGKSFQIVH